MALNPANQHHTSNNYTTLKLKYTTY